MTPPLIEDYDQLDGPERCARRSWDVSNWIFLGAFGIETESAARSSSVTLMGLTTAEHGRNSLACGPFGSARSTVDGPSTRRYSNMPITVPGIVDAAN